MPLLNRFNRPEQATSTSKPAFSETTEAPYVVPPLQLSANDAIEDYLDHVCVDLMVLSYNRRQEIRRELRQHIEAIVAAHEELGEESDTATANALQGFGEPQAIAQGFRSVVVNEVATEAQLRLSTFGAMVRALAGYGSAAMAFSTIRNYQEHTASYGTVWALLLWLLFVLPSVLIGKRMVKGGTRYAGLVTFASVSALLGVAWGVLLYLHSFDVNHPEIGVPNAYWTSITYRTDIEFVQRVCDALMTYLIFGPGTAMVLEAWHHRKRKVVRRRIAR